ncbi:MAG: glycoside hydrolase family 172 protein [bacterium]
MMKIKKMLLLLLCFRVSLVSASLLETLLLGDGSFLKGAIPMRASSSDPNWENGNADFRYIAPKQTFTLAELEGPGIITHIWFTIWAEDKYFPRSLVLRIYWDDNKDPSVESPLGDFFAVGHGLLTSLNSLPVQISSDGRAYNCYWLMPFRKSAKITITNDSPDKAVRALYYMIDWLKLKSLPPDVPYFHAQYRQEYPCEMGKDYLILKTKGKGFYVGTVLSVQMNQPGWFGEGDDRFYIDGEKVPSLRGTGTEDYFNDAWGFRQFNQLYHGVSVWEGYDVDDRGTAYRWHIQDPIPFEKSLLVTIEHKGATYDFQTQKFTSGFAERDDFFSSVAYWYQTGKAPRFTKVPPLEERFVPHTYIEAESLLPTAKANPQDALQIQEGDWSGGKQLFFTPHTPDASLELTFFLPKEGLYVLKLDITHSWDYGNWQTFLDGKEIGQIFNLYSPSVQTKRANLAVVQLSAGEHKLRFLCKGKSDSSSGYYFGLDGIYLRRIK